MVLNGKAMLVRVVVMEGDEGEEEARQVLYSYLYTLLIAHKVRLTATTQRIESDVTTLVSEGVGVREAKDEEEMSLMLSRS
jgi:hypothetical protein